MKKILKSKPKCCDPYCIPICDCCRFFNFNPGGCCEYTGDGYCVLHETHTEPEYECSYFICDWYKRTSDHERTNKIIFKSGLTKIELYDILTIIKRKFNSLKERLMLCLKIKR